MKKWLPLLGLLLLGTVSHAQFVTLFEEDFDVLPPATISRTEDKLSGVIGPGGWTINTTLSVSSPNSMRAQRTVDQRKYLYTDTFSTANLTNVRLEFDQICKIRLEHDGFVEYSIDSGATWTPIPGGNYLGNSPSYPTSEAFNGVSYANPSGTPYWDPFANSTPTNNWWAHEIFDMTSLMIPPSGQGPYEGCIIRWQLNDGNANITSAYAGWYVDNIEVIGATCELQPPTINWLSGAGRPIGARYQSSQEIRLEANDPGSGIDSVLLYYSLNGAPFDTVTMAAANTNSCPVQSQYSHSITGLSVGDTVRWSLKVFDCACPNITIYPNAAAASPTETFWIDVAPPLKCGPTSANSFPYIISTFPFTESFENPNLWVPGSGSGATGNAHRGTWPLANPPTGRNWEVSTLPSQGGYGWCVGNGPTNTANTGPNGDATTGSGNYLFTEATPTFTPNVQTSAIRTPCIDLPVNTCAALEIAYHMYGSDLDVQLPGVLRIDVDTDTNQLTKVPAFELAHILVGQQQGANSGWKTAIVPLEKWAGQTINFRILGVRRSAGDRQDIAIDDFRIFEPDPVDMEMQSFVGPINGLCSYSNMEDIEIIMRSKGCISHDSIPVGFSVSLNGGTPVIHQDTVLDTLSLGEQIQRVFNPKADLSGYGTFEIYAWVNMPGDVNTENDTIGPLIIEHIQPVQNYPYVVTFDDPSTVYGNGTINNPGTIGNPDWDVLPPVAGANLAWIVGNQITEDFNTGPRRDFSKSGNYLYTDSRQVGQNVSRWELNKCLDLNGMTSPNLSFWYHMYGANIDFLKVQVQLDGSTAWTDIPGSSISTAAQKHSDENEAWKWKQIDLSPYLGGSGLIRLRFFARTTGTSNQNDIAIDNMMIWDEAGQSDVGVAYVTSPGFNVNLNAPTPPDMKVFVQNFGGSSVSNIPISVTITDACDPTQTNTVTYTHPGPIAAHAGVEVTLPTPPQYYLGTFRIEAHTGLAGDANSYNDTANWFGSGFHELSIPYANEDFDSCGFDTKGWFTQGGLEAWEHGTPQKGGTWNAAYSAPNSWNLSNTFDYQNQTEILRVPPMINFDTVVGAVLRFRHKYDFDGDDGGRLEFFLQGQWNQFGFSSTQVGSNWYGDAGVNAFGGQEAWAGTAPWTLSEFPLLVWNFNTNPLRLRYIVKTSSTSSGASGWSIDDFSVIVPPQNSVSPIFADTEEYLVVPNTPAGLYAKVQNTGEKELDQCLIRFRVNAGAWSAWDTAAPSTGSWYKGRVITHDFKDKTDPLPPGVHTIEVETSRPTTSFDGIEKNDNRPADDLYSFQVTVLDEVVPTADTSAYCNDFEDPNAVPMVALHSFNKQKDHDWEFGTPNDPNLNGTHSGTNAWATHLDTNYSPVTESSLHTPFFVLDPDSTYKFSFWHKMKSEQYHDGGGVQFSFNGGITWYSLGGVIPDGSWYNTTHVTSLDRLDGGWTGEFDWTYSRITFQVDTPGTVVFRFRFASDFTVDYAGWIIDDFCFNTTDEAPITGPISLEERNNVPILEAELFPNPANSYTDLHINAIESGDAQVRVTNLLGQTLFESTEKVSVGGNIMTINTESWSSGVYMITTELNGYRITKKFIVTH